MDKLWDDVYRKRSKTVFPRILFVKEIPQCFLSSDIAVYHPHTRTIWIRKELGIKTIPTLTHELSHWFIHVFLNNKEKYHQKLDKKI